MKKKVALCITIITIISSIFTSCGNSKPVSTSSEGATKGTGKVNAWGWEIPEKTIEINYYAGQDSPDTVKENSEKMADYILENFNVKLNKIVYDTDVTEKLNLMLSSGDYPECIVGISRTEAQKWIDMGKALDLTDYIDDCPNLKARYGDYLKRYYNEDGRIYQLASNWGISRWADYAAQIRWDYYQEIGAPEIDTPEKYYDALKKIIEKHPTNDKGEKTYAMGFYKSSSALVSTLVNNWGGMFGLKSGWKIDDENNFTYWPETEEGLKMVKFYNQIYRDGLLDPDSFSMNSEQWGEYCANERYVGFVGTWWITGTYGHEKWITLKGDKYNENMRFVHVNVKDPDIGTATYNPKDGMGTAVILTDKCKNPEDYMKWFDFENTELGTRLVGYGLPNEEASVWNFDESTGKWSWNETNKKKIETDTATFDWDGVEKLGGQANFLMTAGAEPLSDGTYYWFDQSAPDKWKKMKDENMKDTIYDFSAFKAITIPQDDILADIKQKVDDLSSTGIVKAVCSKSEAECEAVIKELCEQLKQANIEKLEQYYSEQYKKNINAWK